jgi:Spy/CpxP family protein refolding chaperone
MYQTKPLTLFLVAAFFVTALAVSLMASTYTAHSATHGGMHGKIVMNPAAQKEFPSVSGIIEKQVVRQGSSGQ